MAPGVDRCGDVAAVGVVGGICHVHIGGPVDAIGTVSAAIGAIGDVGAEGPVYGVGEVRGGVQ